MVSQSVEPSQGHDHPCIFVCTGITSSSKDIFEAIRASKDEANGALLLWTLAWDLVISKHSLDARVLRWNIVPNSDIHGDQDHRVLKVRLEMRWKYEIPTAGVVHSSDSSDGKRILRMTLIKRFIFAS